MIVIIRVLVTLCFLRIPTEQSQNLRLEEKSNQTHYQGGNDQHDQTIPDDPVRLFFVSHAECNTELSCSSIPDQQGDTKGKYSKRIDNICCRVAVSPRRTPAYEYLIDDIVQRCDNHTDNTGNRKPSDQGSNFFVSKVQFLHLYHSFEDQKQPEA